MTELAAATDTHVQSLRRLLRGLAAWGLADALPGDRFVGTDLINSFRSDRPGLRNMTLNLQNEGYAVWMHLLYTLRTGEPAFEHAFGKSRWAALGEDPEAAARFNAHMVELTNRVAAGFVANYDFTAISTVADIGGGNGALIAAVLKANPHARGVLFDLPAGLAGAADMLAAAGVRERVELVEGSFFESAPAGCDLYMLKSIVHDWDDERASRILMTCCQAMADRSKLVLLERILPDRFDGPDGLDVAMSDLHMMVTLGGRERTTDEYRELLHAAHLQMTRVIPASSGFGIFEATPF